MPDSDVVCGKFLDLVDGLCLARPSPGVGHMTPATGDQELPLELEQGLDHHGLGRHQRPDGGGVPEEGGQLGAHQLLVGNHHRGLRLRNMSSVVNVSTEHTQIHTSTGVFSVVAELADVGSSMMKEDILEESVEEDEEFGDRDCPDLEISLGVDIRLLFR